MIVLKNVFETSASKVLMNTRGFLGHHKFLKKYLILPKNLWNILGTKDNKLIRRLKNKRV